MFKYVLFMDIKNLINSRFKIVDVFWELDYEQSYLVKQLNDPDTLSCLSVYKITELSASKLQEILTNLKSLSQLKNSENILFPRIIDMFTENDYLFFLYEHLKGDTLSSEIESDRLWDQNTALIEMRNLLENLTYLHSLNLIHQSIKPQSIAINNNSKKLLFNNYGKIINSPSSALMATITIQDRLYLAPEVITGKTAFASDIYAVGILVINMLIGKKIIELAEDDQGNLIWETEVNLEQNLVNILKKMTNININQRYQNIDQVLQDLNTQIPRQNQSISSEINYTPTEIFSPNQSPQNIEEKPTLSQTEIVNPPPEKTSNANQIHSLPDTQISIPSTDNNNSVIYSEPAKNNTVIPPNPPLKVIVIPPNPPLKGENLEAKNNSNQQQKFLLNAQLAFGIINRLKTPKTMIASLAIALFLIFGIGILKSYLHQKYITKISQELKTYYETDKFQECLDLINSDKVKSLPIIDTIESQFLGKCWLGLAELEVIKGNFPEAIRKAVNVDRKSANYEDAKQKIEKWAEQIFLEAENVCKVQKNEALAEEIASNIPESSIWRKKALDLLATCELGETQPTQTYDLCPGPLCPY